VTFVSQVYGWLLLSSVGLFWLFPARSSRIRVLLGASLLFYGLRQPLYVPLLLAGVFLNYGLGLLLRSEGRSIRHYVGGPDPQRRQRHRKRLLGLGIGLNLLLLFGFKYVPFAFNSLGWVLQQPGLLDAASWVDRIAVPLGISFFCFECIAYLVDVYRGAPPALDWLSFCTYKLFFPKLISGPIVRYHVLVGQLDRLDRPRWPLPDRFVEGCWWIACGAVKKGLIADSLGIWVQTVFGPGTLERAGSGDLWLAIIAYGFQLYLDFSGYVDMARGSALLFGIQLPANFDFPYFSTSIADFWRRWHITLGDWLRNYLYIPLGGSRQGLTRTCINLIVVMVLGGLWHGDNWGYVLWGAAHGIALAVHRLVDVASRRFAILEALWSHPAGMVLAWGLTQSMVFISWVWIRLPDWGQSSLVFQRLWGRSTDPYFMEKVYDEALGLDPWRLGIILVLLAVMMGLAWVLQCGLRLQLVRSVKIALVPLCLYLVWVLGPEGVPFIYFDF
jgi:alginate O-acetyltransferase complex protein AlgI